MSEYWLAREKRRAFWRGVVFGVIVTIILNILLHSKVIW